MFRKGQTPAFFLLLALLQAGFRPDDPQPAYYRMEAQKFFALPAANAPINPQNPDYALLDAALFHVTNEARAKASREPLAYSAVLDASASGHSDAMIGRNFYGHENNADAKLRTPPQRIKAAGGQFRTTGENVAQVELVDAGGSYCPRRQPGGEYRYFKCNTPEMFPVFTYLAFAKRISAGFMGSPPHRKNILNADFQQLGCAIRIVKNPYRSRNAPFARITQNFGG